MPIDQPLTDKTPIRVGDPVKYIYNFPPPLVPLVGKISGQVVDLVGEDRAVIRIYTGGFKDDVRLEVSTEELESQVYNETPAGERKRFDAAEKFLPPELELDTLLFDPDSEEYYELGDAEEFWQIQGEELEPGDPPYNLPAYVYICDRTPIVLSSAARLIQDVLAETNNGYGLDDFFGISELETAIREFNVKNVHAKSVKINWKKVVVFTENFPARDKGDLWCPSLKPGKFPDQLWESGEFGQVDLAFTPSRFKLQIKESIRCGFNVDFYPESIEWMLQDEETGTYFNHFRGLARAVWSELYQCYEMKNLEDS
jgi:hypothetical protein